MAIVVGMVLAVNEVSLPGAPFSPFLLGIVIIASVSAILGPDTGSRSSQS